MPFIVILASGRLYRISYTISLTDPASLGGITVCYELSNGFFVTRRG